LFSIVLDQHAVFISLRDLSSIFALDYLEGSSFPTPRLSSLSVAGGRRIERVGCSLRTCQVSRFTGKEH
jgi:hypothetical protein